MFFSMLPAMVRWIRCVALIWHKTLEIPFSKYQDLKSKVMFFQHAHLNNLNNFPNRLSFSAGALKQSQKIQIDFLCFQHAHRKNKNKFKLTFFFQHAPCNGDSIGQMWCVNKQGERITDVGIMMITIMVTMMTMMIWVNNDEESLKWPWL